MLSACATNVQSPAMASLCQVDLLCIFLIPGLIWCALLSHPALLEGFGSLASFG